MLGRKSKKEKRTLTIYGYTYKENMVVFRFWFFLTIDLGKKKLWEEI